MAKGYLPQAIVNYIALLGWNPGDDREFFTLPELIAAFDIDRINKSSASFTLAKLDWLNGEHVRALSPEEFHQIALPYYPAEAVQLFDVAAISRLIQSRVICLTDIPQMVDFLLHLPDFPIALFVHEKSKSTLASSLAVLEQVRAATEKPGNMGKPCPARNPESLCPTDRSQNRHGHVAHPHRHLRSAQHPRRRHRNRRDPGPR